MKKITMMTTKTITVIISISNSNKKNNYDGCKITLADNSVDNSVYPLNKKLLSLELVGFYESFSVTLVM